VQTAFCWCYLLWSQVRQVETGDNESSDRKENGLREEGSMCPFACEKWII